MKIFEMDGKINFVDENNVFVGYDMHQDCCEHADWFIDEKVWETGEYPATIEPYQQKGGYDGWMFDKEFFKEAQNPDYRYLDEGAMAIFRIHKGTEEKFLHIFNAHNGYYGHGFEFGELGVTLREGCL